MIKRFCRRCGCKFMCEPGMQSAVCGRCVMAVHRENQERQAKAEAMGVEFKPVVFDLGKPKSISRAAPVIHRAIERKTQIAKSVKIKMSDERRSEIARRAWATRKANAAKMNFI